MKSVSLRRFWGGTHEAGRTSRNGTAVVSEVATQLFEVAPVCPERCLRQGTLQWVVAP